MKNRKNDPYNMYLGNLFMVQNGVGTVSDIKYVIVRKKKHFLAKPQYFTYPGNIEVLVGSYAVSIEDEGIPFLINATRLHNVIGYNKIDDSQLKEIFVKNNDEEQLQKIKNIKY